MKTVLSRVRTKLESRGGVVALVALSAAVATALLVYLTPLKYVNLVPPAMNSVDPVAFRAALEADPDGYLFIDVRSPNIYNSVHAKDSINIPIENLYNEHYSLPKSGKKIALICTTGRLAAIAYGYLKYQGFNNLVHVQGGMASWTAAGLPIEGKNVVAPSTPDEHQ